MRVLNLNPTQRKDFNALPSDEQFAYLEKFGITAAQLTPQARALVTACYASDDLVTAIHVYDHSYNSLYSQSLSAGWRVMCASQPVGASRWVFMRRVK